MAKIGSMLLIFYVYPVFQNTENTAKSSYCTIVIHNAHLWNLKVQVVLALAIALYNLEGQLRYVNLFLL